MKNEIVILSLSTYVVEGDLNAAHVGGAHCREGEEAILPLAHIHGALVEAEQALQPLGDARPHAEQLACKQRHTVSIYMYISHTIRECHKTRQIEFVRLENCVMSRNEVIP